MPINLFLKPQDGMVTFVSLNSVNSKHQIVIEILTKVLNTSDTELQLDTSNPNWDSLKQLQISLEIEDYFGIQLSDEEAMAFCDVESIVSLVESILKNEG
jgi:acyl carrier protein